MNSEFIEHLSTIKEICKTRISSNKKCEEGCQFYFEKEQRCCFSDTPSGWILNSQLPLAKAKGLII